VPEQNVLFAWQQALNMAATIRVGAVNAYMSPSYVQHCMVVLASGQLHHHHAMSRRASLLEAAMVKAIYVACFMAAAAAATVKPTSWGRCRVTIQNAHSSE